MTTTTTFERKGVYHSELVRAGKIIAKLKGDPRKSKDKNTYYIYFELQDGSEHYYNIENDAIADLLATAPQDVFLELEAAGSRDAATLMLTEANGHPVYQPDPTPAAQPMTGPPPMWDDDPGTGRSVPISRPVAGPLGGDAVARAVESTVRACEALKSKGLPIGGEAVQAIYSTHYIHESKR